MRQSVHIKQEKFEGPLDLLLQLIEQEELSISEISLAKVTDEYLARVKAMAVVDQEALAEFLVVAAQLMLIKSRSLLPQLQLTEEEEISLGDLQRRLAEYKKIKELARALKEKEEAGMHIETRPPYLGFAGLFLPPARFSLSRFSEVMAAIVRAIPQIRELAEERLKKIVSLEEKIEEIHARLASRLESLFSEVVAASSEKVEIIVSFLAILELAKKNLVSLHQQGHFGDITIRKE